MQQIREAIESSNIPSYSLADQVNPAYRAQMTAELSGPLQNAIDLYSELVKASPAYSTTAQRKICLYQAELARFGHDNAVKALTLASQSKAPSEAMCGTVGMMMFHWWNDGNPETQKQELTRMEQLCKTHPKDDLLCSALFDMAEAGAASDEIADAARDIVEKDLTSPEAIR